MRSSEPSLFPRRAWGLAAALAGLVGLVFWPALGLGFLDLDDGDYVQGNPEVTGGLTPSAIAWAFRTTHAANWHPLTWLSHQLDVQLFGLDPAGHHATNVLLHAASAALCLLLWSAWTRRLWASAAVAALFALHPLRVESVAWVSERKDLLCAVFGLGTLLAYSAWCRAGGVARAALVVLLFALGLLAKPMLVTLPFVMLLVDVWPLRRWTGPQALARRVREKLPLFALAATSSWVTYRAQAAGGATGSVEDFPLDERVANAFFALAAYLRQSVWPRGLSVYYPHPSGLGAGVSWSAVALVALGLVALSVVALGRRRDRPALAVGWFWFLGMLVPVIGLLQVGAQAHADRYTYLPHIGLFAALVFGVLTPAPLPAGAGPRSRERVVSVLMLVALAALALVTWRRIPLWKDGETLYRDALAVTSDNFFAHANLGALQLQHGDLTQAEENLRQALAIRPDLAIARNNLALVLARRGRLAEARGEWEAALRTRPDYAEAHNNLAVALESLDDDAGAAAHYLRALELGPRTPQIASNLADLLASSRDPAVRNGAEAERWARLALVDAGRDPRLVQTLAAALAEQGDYEGAVRHQLEALAGLAGPDLAAARARLERYERRTPFRR